MPLNIGEIGQATLISPDGMGIIIVGGENLESGSREKRILESRFNGSKFLHGK